jgi:hypothetical protein
MEKYLLTDEELGSGWNIDMNYTEYLNSVKVTTAKLSSLILDREKVIESLNAFINRYRDDQLNSMEPVRKTLYLANLRETTDAIMQLQQLERFFDGNYHCSCGKTFRIDQQAEYLNCKKSHKE